MNAFILINSSATKGFNLPGIIAAVFPSVSDAPIRLQGKVIDHVFESSGEIASSIKTFYTSETLKQVYKIIGSLDFVGNPTILFSSFVSGVRDLVAAPASAFLKSPTNVNQVGIAVGMGTLSLFSHSASGIFEFAAKMSATAGQAAAVLSLDKEFRQWHRDNVVSEATNLNRVWKQRGVQSIREMLSRPLGDIFLGVAMGASGLIISPYKGLKNGGGVGFLRGIAIGTAGVVAKPLVGVLDAFTHFSATAYDVAKSVNVLERRFQPALKLRLPYTFGPMNILSPFDPVSARSVYLLRAFPVKRKYLKGQKLAKEILVHAEVLHMEPGVDTFAIATTIRVALIRLKKDATGNLLPAMGWEVVHSDDAKVASRILEHGHNGVAMTITRRLAADKTEEIKGSKFKRSKAAPEVLNTPTFSSALSIDSGFSDLEEDEGTGADETDDFFHESQQQTASENADLEITELDPAFDHGATKKGDEVVKWFTVLAEYQHRPQLTRLHNAISSLVGDYDAIIRDQSLEGQEREGVTSFGVFNFEKPMVSQRSIVASNAELVMSLEGLPWVHGHVFERIGRLPKSEQRDLVREVRMKWTFATDFESSKWEGGPTWLVEERARAMSVSVSPDSKTPLGSWDSDDPAPGCAIADNMRANRSVDARRILTFKEIEKDGSPGYLPGNAFERGGTLGDDKQAVALQTPGQAQLHGSALNIEEDLFHSVNFHESILNRMLSGSSTSSDSMYSVDAGEIPSERQMDPILGLETEDKSSPLAPAARFTQGSLQAASADASMDVGRIDRMESLMEQLVTINARRLKQPTMPDISGDCHSLADSSLADKLQKEVAELRSQVQARTAKDDALREELILLRQQLADRREERNSKQEERPSRIKLPEMLRFGAKKGEGKKDVEPGESPDSLPYRVYQAPLKDTPEEHDSNRAISPATRGAGTPRPARRYSADSSARVSVASAETPSVKTGNRPARRPSNELSMVVAPVRRASLGSGGTRLGGRRMSGGQYEQI